MNVLLIDNDQPFRDAVCRLIESKGHHAQPAVSGEAGLLLLNESRFDAVLLDAKLDREKSMDVLRQIIDLHPNLPVVMFTAESTIALVVEAMQSGAADFLEKPFAPLQLDVAMSRVQRLKRQNQNNNSSEQEFQKAPPQNTDLLLDFASPAMLRVREIVSRAAKSSATILITGESGTGKSVLARMMHDQSHLAGKPFVTVSCPSLSKDLLESDLFGHTVGSFTGAIKDHWGKVKAAGGGTLFLDEIGDLPLEIQPKLLRLLQEQEYERLGENITHKANVRVIVATNRDLRKRIAEGAFREDLYFRLNVISVEMPPLRARNTDLLQFANHYLQYFAAECGRKMRDFSGRTLRRMEAHSWPGNLRELRNTIQRAVILAPTDRVDAEDLLMELPDSADSGFANRPGDLVPLKKIEEMHVKRVIARTGSMAESARVLGIHQATLYRKQKEWVNNKCHFPELAC